MKNRLRTFMLSMLGMKYLLFVPLLVLWVVIPALVKMYSDMPGGQQITERIIQMVTGYIPLFAVWWNIFILKEYLDGPARELYYVYDLHRHSRLPETCLLTILYLLCMGPTVLMFGNAVPEDAVLFTAALTVLFSAVAYLLAFVFRSAYFSLAAVLLYYVVCSTVPGGDGVWSVYRLPLETGYSAAAAWIGLLSVAMFAIGFCAERRLYRIRL